MFFKNLLTFLTLILINEVSYTKSQSIKEIGYGYGTEYNNWSVPPKNFSMIFHKKELPKGILFGFSGYVLRDADVYFQIWQKENNIFELVQEYKYKVKKVKPLGVTERQAFLITEKCVVTSPKNFFGIYVPGPDIPFPIIFNTEILSIIDANPKREPNTPNITILYYPYTMSISTYVDTDLSKYGSVDGNKISCRKDLIIPLTNSTLPGIQTTQSQTVPTPGAAETKNNNDDGGLDEKYLILIIVLSILLFIFILLGIFLYVRYRAKRDVLSYETYKEYPEDVRKSKGQSSSTLQFITREHIQNHYHQTMSSKKSDA